MRHQTTADTINKVAYRKQSVVRWYSELDLINKAEVAVLQKLYPSIKDGKLLDIGIGGGRTTKHLLDNISKNYLGIDYTFALAEVTKRKFPSATIVCADARALPSGDEVFDFALFSLNGIDYMDHQGRVSTLKEVLRILKPGGFYLFSTHNRDYKNYGKFDGTLHESLSLSQLKSYVYTLLHWPRHLVMRKHEVSTDEYAIINDNAHGYSLLTYYITVAEQIKQLEAAGFLQIEAYDMEGHRVNAGYDFPWSYYLARKPLNDSHSRKTN
jgi:SAM-dependent methyltransferase